MESENQKHTFGGGDICRATLPNGEQFECRLSREMRDWDFSAWEVRITKGSSLGCTTHVRGEQLELVEAYDPDTHSTSRYSYR